MFGTNEHFNYVLCDNCGCLQIEALPLDMEKFYPPAYYSLQNTTLSVTQRVLQLMKDALRVYGSPKLFRGMEWFEYGEYRSIRDAKVGRADRILDIGCGSGSLLASLRSIGFAHVEGADPFVGPNFTTWNGVHIHNKTAAELSRQYDVVMMHHSLEHVWDQRGAIQQAKRLLRPGGRLIVRIPTKDSWAFENFGENWIQLDPPRHFYLHSRKSIRILLETQGLVVQAIVDDSSSFQIVGSEMIMAGLIPNIQDIRRDPVAWARVAELNAIGRGDSLAIHALRPLQGPSGYHSSGDEAVRITDFRPSINVAHQINDRGGD